MSHADSGRRVALNTASAWVANAVAMVVGFCLTPFLLRCLGDRLYGLQSLAVAVASWCAFAASPIGTYTARYATEHFERGEAEEMNRTLATALLISLAAAAMVSLFVLGCAWGAGRLFGVSADVLASARTAIIIVGLGSAVTLVLRVWEATVFVSRRFYLQQLITTGARVLAALLIVAWFLWFSPSLNVWLFLVVWLPLILSVLLIIPLASRGLRVRFGWRGATRAEARRALPFILLLALGGVGSQLFEATDPLVISKMRELGLDQVAAYDLGARWMRLIRPLIDAFVLAMSPALVALVAQRDHAGLARAVSAGTRRAILLGLIPVLALGIVAPSFIHYWVGQEYVSRSVPVMWIMLAAVILSIPGMYAYRILVAVSRLGPLTVGATLAGLFNLGLSIALVRYGGMGLSGVAAGTLVAMFIWSGIGMPLLACRHAGVPMARYFYETWSRPLLASAAMLAIGGGINHLWTSHRLLDVLILLTLLGTLFVPIILATGLTADERAWLGKRLRDRLERSPRRLAVSPPAGRAGPPAGDEP